MTPAAVAVLGVFLDRLSRRHAHVSSREFQERLARRRLLAVGRTGAQLGEIVLLPAPRDLEQKINLDGSNLAIRPEALDRLLIEPLLAGVACQTGGPKHSRYREWRRLSGHSLALALPDVSS